MKWITDLCQMKIRIEVRQHLDFELLVCTQNIQDPAPGLHLKTQDQITDYKLLSAHGLSSPGLERHSLFLSTCAAGCLLLLQRLTLLFKYLPITAC